MTTSSPCELYGVRVARHVRIPMSDGVELDAHLFMPDAPGQFPAVFDYYPYRKDDLSAGNLRYQYYLAQRGYVGIRVDVRGTGSSVVLPVTNILCKSSWMVLKPSPGWHASPGQPASSACLVPPMAASTRSKLPCTAHQN